MTIFRIGDTDFGVDLSKSSVGLIRQSNGVQELSIDVHGDKEVFLKLTEAEDAAWSWALYPPSFFLRGVEISARGSELAQPVVINGEFPDAECGIYMMEFNDLYNVCIQEFSVERLKISGGVDLLGKIRSFEIDISRDAQAGNAVGRSEN